MKPRLAKLGQEGAAFLRPGDSGKPLRLGEAVRFRDRLSQDEFRAKNMSAWPHDPREFPEDLSTRGVEIENAVGECHIHQGQPYDLCLAAWGCRSVDRTGGQGVRTGT